MEVDNIYCDAHDESDEENELDDSDILNSEDAVDDDILDEGEENNY